MTKRWARWAMGLGLIFPGILGATEPDLSRHLMIFYTSTIAGELEPCGCTTGPLGGFEYRGPMIERLTQAGIASLGLDGGNLLLQQSLQLDGAGGSKNQRAKLLLDLVEHNGISAMAIGLSDVQAVGLSTLQTLQNGRKIQFLSANLQDLSGQQAFKASTTFQVGPHKIGVVGLTGCERFHHVNSDYQCVDSLEAVKAPLQAFEGQVDLVIALSNLTPLESDKLAQAYPQIDFILGGEGDRSDAMVAGVHDRDGLPPFRTALGTQGRFIGRLDILFSENAAARPMPAPELGDGLREEFLAREALAGLKQQIIEEEGQPNPERFLREGAFQRRKIDRATAARFAPREQHGFFYQELPVLPGEHVDEVARLRIEAYRAEKDKAVAALAESYESVLSFAGTNSCRGCHPLQTAAWMGTKHAKALDTLKDIGRHQDPTCIGCHTTGYKQQGGFFNPERSAEFAHVGCESCHGPLGDHPNGRRFIGEVPEKTCVGCHDALNSPGFIYKKEVPGVTCPSGVNSDGQLIGETHGTGGGHP